MNISPEASVLTVIGKSPAIAGDAFVAAGARVIGDVTLGPKSSVWYNAVVLGDTVVPPGSLVAGVPAKVRRELSDEERAGLHENAQVYLHHIEEHLSATEHR